MKSLHKQRGYLGNSAVRASMLLGIRPSFDLPLDDLGNGIVNLVPRRALGSSLPTFTRASTAYTMLANGLHGLVASGSPRSMYSPAGIYLGYQAEGARSDVLGTTAAIRRTMTDVGWVVGATMTVGAATGTDGVASAAASLTGGAVTATNTILFTTGLGSAARTFIAWVRRKTGTGTIEMTDNGGTNWTDITSTLTTTYKQFQVTRTQANPIVGFRITTNLDAIEVDWNTIEAATFANPTPIPLNVAKAADVLTYPTAGNVSGTVGSVYAEFVPVQVGTQITLLGADGFRHYMYANPNFLSIADGTNVAGAANPFTANVVSKGATAWGGSAMFTLTNGTGIGTSAFDGNMNAGVNFAVGSNTLGGGGPYFGTIRNVRIYPVALSAAKLQAMTTP